MKEKMIAILLKNIDLKGLVADTIDEVLESSLRKFVADTANPYDNTLVDAFYPMLETIVKKEINDLIDSIEA